VGGLSVHSSQFTVHRSPFTIHHSPFTVHGYRYSVDRERFKTSCVQIGVGLSEFQLNAFERFEENLYAANQVMNLTRVPREECWLRHFVDSLLIHEFILDNSTVLDIGSGPGFPAWPLACARPDLKVTALDSSNKMTGFVRNNPLTNLEVMTARAEQWGVRGGFDVVTGRALAPLPIQIELSASPTKIGGLVIPMRSANEISQAQNLKVRKLGLTLLRIEERALPGTDIIRAFPIYEKTDPTPKRYPRAWTEIKRQPIA